MSAAAEGRMLPDDSGQGSKIARGLNPQPIQAAQIPDALLTLRTAGAIGGISSSTIYRKSASDPTFPKLVKLSSRCTRIRAGCFMAWLAAQAGAAE